MCVDRTPIRTTHLCTFSALQKAVHKCNHSPREHAWLNYAIAHVMSSPVAALPHDLSHLPHLSSDHLLPHCLVFRIWIKKPCESHGGVTDILKLHLYISVLGAFPQCHNYSENTQCYTASVHVLTRTSRGRTCCRLMSGVLCSNLLCWPWASFGDTMRSERFTFIWAFHGQVLRRARAVLTEAVALVRARDYVWNASDACLPLVALFADVGIEVNQSPGVGSDELWSRLLSRRFEHFVPQCSACWMLRMTTDIPCSMDTFS